MALFKRYDLDVGALGYHVIDTATLVYEHLAHLGLHRLSLKVACQMLGVSNEGAHTALADTVRCEKVFNKLMRAGLLTRLFWGMRWNWWVRTGKVVLD